MVKNIIGLLIGLSILGYGGYHSIKLASFSKLSKPGFVSTNNTNIDLSEEKWTKPVVKPQVTVPAAPPVVAKPPKGKRKKKAGKQPPQTTCNVGGGRFKVSGTHMTCRN